MGESYTRAHVARICKVSSRRLRYWERTALVARTARRGRSPVFGFRDLASVRSLRGLVDQGVSVRRIRRCLEGLRRTFPEIECPALSLRLWMEGSERVVVRHRGALLEPDGQTVLDLGAAGGDAGIAPLAPRRHGDDPLRAAAEWFERGCALDTDPAHYAEAREAYTRALELDPGFADAHCNLGAVLFNQSRRREARDHFQRALALEPGHPEAHLNLATLLEEEGEPVAALDHYRAALVSQPHCADAHVSLALLYERLGSGQRALAHWRAYLGLAPGGAWAKLARRRLD